MKIRLGAYVTIAVFAIVVISAWNGDPRLPSWRRA